MMKFPWAELMHLGLGRLRLSPRDFWAMTLRELHAALGVRQPLRRAELDDLMRRFPDHG
ncbi:hypothetical protein BH10PSE7_BH10PSE7_03700 [soil metagenome]